MMSGRKAEVKVEVEEVKNNGMNRWNGGMERWNGKTEVKVEGKKEWKRTECKDGMERSRLR